MKKILSICFLLLVIIPLSCTKEIGKPSWNTEVLTPLVKSSMNMDNFISTTLIKLNPDSSLKMIYNYDFYDFKAEKLVQIPDTLITDSFHTPIPTLAQPGEILIQKTDESKYNFNGVDLKKVILKSELLRFRIVNPIKEIVVMNYEIPSATLNGTTFKFSISVPAGKVNSPGIYDSIYSLAGYTIDLTGINHNKVNYLVTYMKAIINPSALQSVSVWNTDTVIFSTQAINMVPSYAKGYFGQSTFKVGPDASSFGLFDRIIGGHLQLEDALINISIENNIGEDLSFTINALNSLNSKTNQLVLLRSPIIGIPHHINRAVENNAIGTLTPSIYNIKLNKTNSNIKELIEGLPSKLGYTLQIQTNPLENVSGGNDFIYTNKSLKASIELEIPLSITAKDLTLVDTVTINLGKINDENKIHGDNSLTLFVNNGFPFEAQAKFYFLNKANNIIDSISISPNLISSASLDVNFKVNSKKLSQLLIPFSEKNMKSITKAKFLMIVIKFNSSNYPNKVKIYKSYSIDLKIIADFNYTFNLK